jgi:Tfp pilus assembly protein PilN
VRAVNLLPREAPRPKRRALPLTTQLLVGIPLLAVALVGVLWLLAGSGISGKRQTLAELRAELAALPAPKVTVARNPNLTLHHQERVAALAGALDGRLAWDRILRHIAAVIPSDVWLTKLATLSDSTSQTPTTAAPPLTTTETPVATAPEQVEIGGYTYSQEAVARFLSRLDVVPDLSAVQLRSSTRTLIGDRAVDQFSIVVAIRPNGSSA